VFWARVEPFVPVVTRTDGRQYRRQPGAGRKPIPARQIFSAIVYVLRTAASGRLCRVNSVVPARFTHTFNDGNALAFFSACGRQDSPNTTRWRASPGAGKASMGPCIRLLWQPNAWGRTPRIGEKNGRKRSLLVDARGVPLSLVASGANRHDVKLLEATLRRIVCPRPQPNPALPQSLCMDTGYTGYDALVTTRKLGYQHNLQSRRQESESKLRSPGHIARRWWWREHTRGSIASANCSSASRRRRKATSPCFLSPRHDLLETDNLYLRISSKSGLGCDGCGPRGRLKAKTRRLAGSVWLYAVHE